MKKLLTLIALVVTVTTFGQSVAISDDGSVADASAILDVKSTTKGFLPPRMTIVQRDAIASPATGLQIWCSDCDGGETQIFNGSIWTNFIKAEADRAAAAEQANADSISSMQEQQKNQDAAIGLNSAKTGQSSGTTTGDMQYWNGTVWVVVAATVNEAATLQMIGGVPTWTGGTPPPPEVGNEYQGGKVFYIFQAEDTGYVEGETHGLIAAPFDAPADPRALIIWGCRYNTPISGADGTAIGTGAQNTRDIESGCSDEGGAADFCANLTVNGYSDWYLPSIEELQPLHDNREEIGGFSTHYYWSSTEISTTLAKDMNFGDPGAFRGNGDKGHGFHVRAIRSF